MGLLERMGLVERTTEEEPKVDYDYDESVDSEELPEVNTDGVSQENLIADIYTANNLTDSSSSIFKVEEIRKTLPSTMATETMKGAVIGTLGVFGLTPEGLMQDARERMNILLSAQMQINNENMAVINARKQEIENAKKQIELCEAIIADHEKAIETSTDEIDAEVKRISDLNVFLGGESFVGGTK